MNSLPAGKSSLPRTNAFHAARPVGKKEVPSGGVTSSAELNKHPLPLPPSQAQFRTSPPTPTPKAKTSQRGCGSEPPGVDIHFGHACWGSGFWRFSNIGTFDGVRRSTLDARNAAREAIFGSGHPRRARPCVWARMRHRLLFSYFFSWDVPVAWRHGPPSRLVLSRGYGCGCDCSLSFDGRAR